MRENNDYLLAVAWWVILNSLNFLLFALKKRKKLFQKTHWSKSVFMIFPFCSRQITIVIFEPSRLMLLAVIIFIAQFMWISSVLQKMYNLWEIGKKSSKFKQKSFYRVISWFHFFILKLLLSFSEALKWACPPLDFCYHKNKNQWAYIVWPFSITLTFDCRCSRKNYSLHATFFYTYTLGFQVIIKNIPRLH